MQLEMGKLRVIINILNFLTGRTMRHNRALRNIRDWAATVQKFLSEYQLYGNSNIDFLLENNRKANFDLIAMAHKGNVLIKPASKIRDAQVSPLLTKVVDEIENMRRAMMSPTLRNTRLPEVISRLRVSFEKLQENLSAIKYI
jgi:hypothetical protein